ncbi:hypothetical protein [Mycobacterium sp. Marseille-P9652]|uniref:hypothetical protein n=1 Tax=Mycobacterium sp. Marseille-P9652 TaxID=2654950 RepID=UPI0012E99131|nr:hypothetical protein [Mycobacterium sp. Marseille-P9652]
MTESGRHARTTGTDDDAIAHEDASPFDPELVRLVQFVNAVDGAEVGLTLHLKGCVVSGMLISVAQYYRMLVEEFTEPNRSGAQANPEVAASFAKFYRPALEKVERSLEDSRTGEAAAELPRHIHFRHAQTVVGGQIAVTRSLWRGRLGEVDGWSFGSFGPVRSPNQGVDL